MIIVGLNGIDCLEGVDKPAFGGGVVVINLERTIECTAFDRNIKVSELGGVVIGKNSHFLFTFLGKCDKITLNPARFLWIVLGFVL